MLLLTVAPLLSMDFMQQSLAQICLLGAGLGSYWRQSRRLQTALLCIGAAGGQFEQRAAEVASLIRHEATRLDAQRDSNHQAATALHELAAALIQLARYFDR